MATYTKYKNLEKPLSTENYNIAVANKNNDVIDSELHKLELKNQSQDELLATKEDLNKTIEQNKTIVEALDATIRNKVSQTDILKSIESVNENTLEGKVADALVIKEVFQSVSNGKQLVASAITDKGVNTEATDTFTTMAENIKSIPSNGTGEIESPLICRFYYDMNIDLNSTRFRFYFPIKKVKKLIIKNLYFTVSKQREANNRNFYLQIYGKNGSRIFKIKEFVGIADFIGIKTIIDLEDTEIDINDFDSVEYFDIYSPSVTLNYLYGLNLEDCIFELYT